MSLHTIIPCFAAIGVLLGAADHLLGNRFGLGKKFMEAFEIMGSLALSMAGIIVIAPVLAKWLQPILVPVFRWMHADPAMFASIIANDMGGYSLATLLAQSEEMGLMAGCIIASMLGCTLVFSLPVGMGIIRKEDVPCFIRGLLLGLITIPVGSVIGGLTAGFNPADVLVSNIPIAVFSAFLAVCFATIPEKTCKVTNAVGKGIGIIGVIGIAIGVFSHLTKVDIPLFEDIDSIIGAFTIVGEITAMLLGILPILELLTRRLKKPLALLGRMLGMNAVAASGLIYTLANPLPTFGLFKDMDDRGKILNIAWMVSAAAALGDHLGFTAGVRPDMIAPMLAGKFSSAACALVIAWFATMRMRTAKDA